MFLKTRIKKYMNNYLNKIHHTIDQIRDADAIVIGAGAGLSTSAGFLYSGERFQKYFSDFEDTYGYHDMYSGSFYDYESLEEMWAFWSRDIFINRYMDAPNSVYNNLLELVKDKNYFVLTTNVDHCFQKAGFDKKRLFYTQGDYGLFQCSDPCHQETYDNELMIKEMLKDQGFRVEGKTLHFPVGEQVAMKISSTHIPKCPRCGKPMTMNLRSDHSFVEDEGWHLASDRYHQFLEENKNKKLLFIELGVGYNTPGIIKYPFWQYTYNWPKASYICINKGQAAVPAEIKEKSICVDGDITEIITFINNEINR